MASYNQNQQLFIYQTSRDADSPEADAQLVTETILFASKNYPEVRKRKSIISNNLNHSRSTSDRLLCFRRGFNEHGMNARRLGLRDEDSHNSFLASCACVLYFLAEL